MSNESNKVNPSQEENMPQSVAPQWDILSKAPMGMLVSRISDGTILFINQRAADLVGYSVDELLGQATPDFYYHPAERRTVLETVQQEGALRDFELIIKQKDGTPVWVLLSIEPIDFENQPALLSGLQPIAAQKEAEQELRFLSTAVEQAGDGIAIADLDGNLLYANQAWADMHGYRVEELTGKHLSMFHTEEQLQNEVAPFNELVMKNGSNTGEVGHVRKDGTTFPTTMTTTIRRDDDGNPVGLIGAARDITAHQKADVAVQQLAAIVESSSEAIMSTTPKGEILSWNPAAERMFGYTPDDLIGKPALILAPPDVQEEAKAILMRLAQGETVPPTETVRLAKDGSRIDVLLNASAIQDDQGNVVGFSATLTDITDRKQAEKELHAAQQRAENIIEALPLGMYFYHLEDDGRLVMTGANQLANEMVGVDNSQFFGLTIEEAFPALAETEIPDRYRQAARDGTFWSTEQVAYDEGQISGAFEVYAFQSSPNNMVAAFLNITDRLKDTEQIRESQQRLALMVEQSPLGVIEWNLNFEVSSWNPAAEQVFGYSAAEALGKHATELIIPEEVRPMIEPVWQDLLRQEGGTRSTNENITKDGRTIICEWYNTTLVNADGKTIGVVSVVQEITERKRYEDELRRRSEIETLLTSISSKFVVVESQDLDQTITQTLDDLGKFAGADRSYLFLISDDRASMDNTHEWCAAGIQAHIDDLKDIPINTFPWLMQKLENHQNVNIPLVADLPPEAQAEKTEFQAEKIQSIVIVPIIYQNTLVGFLGFDAVAQQRNWEDDLITLLRTVGETIITTIERYKLQNEVERAFERRGYQVQVSTEIAQEISQASELGELFEQVVTLTKEQLGYYHTQLLRYDPGQDAVVLITGYGEIGQKMFAEGHRMPMGSGLIGTAAETGETVMRPDLAEDPDWQPNPLLPETRGEIAVPIKLGDEILGVLDVQSDRAGAITDDDRLLLEGLCGQIAIAIDQTRLRQEMDERLQELDNLYRAMSHEGWQQYRDDADLPDGFIYDQTAVRSVEEATLADELFANIPMSLPGGEVLGEMGIADAPDQPLSDEDKAFIQQVSEQVALALESARLFEQTQSALQEVRRSEEALREVSELQTAILEGAEYALIATTPEGILTAFNPGAERMLGYTAEELVGKSDPGIFHDLDEVVERAKVFSEELGYEIEPGFEVFVARSRQNLPNEYEWTYIHKDGTRIPVLLSVSALRDDDGNITGFLGIASDITERKEIQAAMAKRASELATVAEVGTAISTILDPGSMLKTVVDLTKERFDLYHAHIYMLSDDGKTLELTAGAGEVGDEMVSEGWQIPLDAVQSLVAQVARERRGVIVNDVQKNVGFMANPLLPDTASELAVPLLIGDHVLGVLDVQSDQVDYFTDEDVNIQTTLAAQISVALQNARTYASTQRQAEHEALVNLISQRIQSTTSVENALQVAIRELGRALGAKRTSVQLGIPSKGKSAK